MLSRWSRTSGGGALGTGLDPETPAYLIEEVFELDQALSDNDRAAIQDEVADLLLHLAWQLVLADQHDELAADQIADDLEKK